MIENALKVPLRTGIPFLDRIQGGFKKGELMAFAVPPRPVRHIVPAGMHTIALEMSESQMLARFGASGWPFMSTAQLEGKGVRVTHGV